MGFHSVLEASTFQKLSVVVQRLQTKAERVGLLLRICEKFKSLELSEIPVFFIPDITLAAI